MQPEQQQRIMGYFIEEAKDHLNTIERGLLNLQNTIAEPEMVNEVFRAAHSVKGGAAMLGLNAIQHSAHRLEDYFKVLKDSVGIQVDQRLESLLLRVFDTLQELVEQLQSPFGMTEASASQAMAAIAPVFEEIDSHLASLAGGAVVRSGAAAAVSHVSPQFHERVTADLRELLELFKRADILDDARSHLLNLSDRLQQHGTREGLTPWVNLVEQVKSALDNPDNSYRTLASVIIKELKQAQDWIRLNQPNRIRPSASLLALLPLVGESSQSTTGPAAATADLTNADLTGADWGDLAADMGDVETELDFISDDLDTDFSDLDLDRLDTDALSSDIGMDFDALLRATGLEHAELDAYVNLETDLDHLLNSAATDTNGLGAAFESLDAADTNNGLGLGDNARELDLLSRLDAALLETTSNNDAGTIGLDEESTTSLDLDDLFIGVDEDEFTLMPGVGSPLRDDRSGAAAVSDTQEDMGLEDRALDQADQLLDDTALNHVADDLSEDLTELEFVDEAVAALDGLTDDVASFDDLSDLDLNAMADAAAADLNITDLEPDFEADAQAAAAALADVAGLTQDLEPADITASPLAGHNRDALGIVVDTDAKNEGGTRDRQIAADALSEAESSDLADLSLDELILADGTDQDSAAAVEPNDVWQSDLSQLEALLADVPNTAVGEPDFGEQETDSEFDDLDKLLLDEQDLSPRTTSDGNVGTTPAAAQQSLRSGKGFSNQTMRISVNHLDNLSNLVGELVVNRNSLEQDQERLRQSLDNLLYQVQQLSDVGHRMQDLYERSLLENSLLASRQKLSQLPFPISQPIEASTTHEESLEEAYDPLEMDRFTGFHTLSQEMIELIVRVRESASDIEFVVDETDQVTRMFRQVTTQLQEGLTRSRMVPFAQAADRLPRAVRDITTKVGKQAELVVEGRDTLIDKMILEHLYDPMTHLVNNAITHGIERPEERRAVAKPDTGRITIRAFHQGNQTVISVSDDGAGIDVERVRLKAIEKGLISRAEAATMSRLELFDLIFHPGFTTRDQADNFAGRGVGMDVVRTSLTEVRGVVTIDSTPNKGTTFTIRLPLTLSISKALCCISDRARIAFPMDGVEDMFDLPQERLQTNANGQVCVPWGDTVLPLRPLTELLAYNRHLSRGNVYGSNQEEDIISVVVLRSAGNYLALQVDQVLGEQEIVIKQLEGPVPKPIGIAGATVLGDGRIMPIADVLELIDLATGRLRRDTASLWEQDGAQAVVEAPPTKTDPLVLIVDDSITVRELLSMTFNKVGYRVEQARDGQEAWEKLRAGLPCDIVFCDIEMPRMDGLELLSRIQKDPHLQHLPVAMLTSRGADRHRQMANSLGAKGYFTKPYLEEALLDAAARILKGEVLIG